MPSISASTETARPEESRWSAISSTGEPRRIDAGLHRKTVPPSDKNSRGGSVSGTAASRLKTAFQLRASPVASENGFFAKPRKRGLRTTVSRPFRVDQARRTEWSSACRKRRKGNGVGSTLNPVPFHFVRCYPTTSDRSGTSSRMVVRPTLASGTGIAQRFSYDDILTMKKGQRYAAPSIPMACRKAILRLRAFRVLSYARQNPARPRTHAFSQLLSATRRPPDDRGHRRGWSSA